MGTQYRAVKKKDPMGTQNRATKETNPMGITIVYLF